jgi:hypothetical protein
MTIEAKLERMGLTLPAPLVPPGNFQLVKVHAGLAYVAGHGPFDGATPLVQGLVGRDVMLDEGYQAARLTALSILASLKRELCDLDRVAAVAPSRRLRPLRPRLRAERRRRQRLQRPHRRGLGGRRATCALRARTGTIAPERADHRRRDRRRRIELASRSPVRLARERLILIARARVESA